MLVRTVCEGVKLVGGGWCKRWGRTTASAQGMVAVGPGGLGERLLPLCPNIGPVPLDLPVFPKKVKILLLFVLKIF